MCAGLGGEGKSKNQGWRIGPLPRSKQKNTGTIFGEGWNVLRRFPPTVFPPSTKGTCRVNGTHMEVNVISKYQLQKSQGMQEKAPYVPTEHTRGTSKSRFSAIFSTLGTKSKHM